MGTFYDPRALGAECDTCPLNGLHNPVPARGPQNAKILLLGEAPGRKEIERGKAFVGDSGRMLYDLFAEAWRLLPPGIPRVRVDDIRIVNTIEHKPPGGDIQAYLTSLRNKNLEEKRRHRLKLKELRSKGITAKELKIMVTEGVDPRLPPPPKIIRSPVEACWPRVRRELRGRAVIIPVGALALSVLDKKRTKILRWRGSPFRLDPGIFNDNDVATSKITTGGVRGVRIEDHVRPVDGGHRMVGRGRTDGRTVQPLFDRRDPGG